MAPKFKQQRVLTGLFLMILILMNLPAQARSNRPPETAAWREVTALGDDMIVRIGDLLLGLWQRGTTKEGVLIDPNGSPHSPGTPSYPSGTSGEEGTSIDPDGKP